MKQFFISYNSKDSAWAEWIAWQLEEKGFTTELQAWDFLPGENFVQRMHQATTETVSTIAVLSPNYLSAKFTQPEWNAAFSKDPTGEHRKLIPILVQKCNLQGLLPQIIYINLTELTEEDAKKKLIFEIKETRLKPMLPPVFPVESSPPKFPGEHNNRDDVNITDNIFNILTVIRNEMQNMHLKIDSLMDRVEKTERLIYPPYFEIPNINELATMDYLGNIEGKIILIKSDLDIPILKDDYEIIDHPKFERAQLTLDEVVRKGGKVVLLITQGLSKTHFDKFTIVPLDKHIKFLLKKKLYTVYNYNNIYEFEGIKKKIKEMKSGEIVILPNLATLTGDEAVFYNTNFQERKFNNTGIVRLLNPIYDYFIMDDFRSTIKCLPSNVGFSENKPSFIGRGVENDLSSLSMLINLCKSTKGQRVCIACSSRPKDLEIILTLLDAKLFDIFLVGGYPALILLLANGIDIGKIQHADVYSSFDKELNADILIEKFAKPIISKHFNKIYLPKDFALEIDDKRIEVSIEKLPEYNAKIMDIGSATIAYFSRLINSSELIFHFGMLGRSYPPFNTGTVEIIKSIASSNSVSFLAGDHINGIARKLNVDHKINYKITGAETTNHFLTGKNLPGLDIFRNK
ncbi:phosphoglycerate kinase [Candidatus Electronema sp. JC]|uniref:phosphoglycerate kinase n=1 Tax=Candidatus Electronema sp. JC TaxID=3401570 RepID=UPI003B42AB6B